MQASSSALQLHSIALQRKDGTIKAARSSKYVMKCIVGAAVASSSYCRCCLLLLLPLVVVSLQQSVETTCIRYASKRSIIILSPTSLNSKSSYDNERSSNDDDRQQQQKLGRRGRKKRLEELQKQRRRNRWMKRYGTVEALQQTFGTGPPWGDLSPTQTRSLYHTLLPRSLLALNEMGLSVTAEDLAPLAYEARIAAKEYARTRCIWTGRVGVFIFDQYRSLRDKGQLIQPGSSSSMSWEEIWSKYEKQIIEEHDAATTTTEQGKKKKKKKKELDEDELMMQTYMRILERSCSTNQTFDNLFLKEEDGSGGGDISLASIASQLEHDVRAILLSPSELSKVEKKVKKMERKLLKEREKEENEKIQRRKKADRMKEKQKREL